MKDGLSTPSFPYEKGKTGLNPQSQGEVQNMLISLWVCQVEPPHMIRACWSWEVAGGSTISKAMQ